jgi:hypothetical protein
MRFYRRRGEDLSRVLAALETGERQSPPGARLRALAIAIVAGCMVLALFWWAGSASAAITHKYKETIAGVSASALTTGPAGPEGTATEQSALYVAGGTGVERFSSAEATPPSTALPFSCVTTECQKYVKGNEIVGTPSGEVFGEMRGVPSVAVDDATGEIFVSAYSAVDIFSASGEYLGQVTEVPVSAEVHGPFHGVDGSGTAGVAFDQETKELYLANEGEQTEGHHEDVVDVFKREGPGNVKYEAQFGYGVLSSAGDRQQTVAVVEPKLGVETGRVYVTDTTNSVVDVFEDSIVDMPPSSSAPPVAVWGGHNTLAGSFTFAPGLGTLFVATDPVSGRVYVATHGYGFDFVDELEASVNEESLGRLTGTPSGAFELPSAVAVSRTSQDLYVGDPGKQVVDVFGPELKLPEVKAEAVSAKTSTSATLNGKVTLAKEPATCEFVWGTSETELDKTVSCEPEVVAGEEGEFAVEAKLGELTSGTTYYFKLQATNTEPGNGETNTGEDEKVEQFTTKGPQFIAESLSVADVASTSATFNASVDPNGADTSAYFEYGACSSLSACATAGYEGHSPAQAIGSGDGAIPIEAHVQGLQAGSAYHYRVVGVSEIEPGKVEDFDGIESGTFSTQAPGAFSLIDGRAWEMVSPPQKEGALIQGPGPPWGITQAADTGDAFTFLTNVPTEAGVAGYANSQQVFSTRTSAGWVSKDLSTPHNGSVSASVEAGQEYRFFNEDLTEGILQPFGAFQPCTNASAEQPCLSKEASEQTAFMRDDTTGGYTPLVSPADDTASPFEPFGQVSTFEGQACPPQKFCGPFFDGATPDGSHVVLSSARGIQLTSEPAPEGGLYEWSGEAQAGERLQLVSVLPAHEGKPEEPYLELASLGTPAGQSGRDGDGADARHAISNDGSRVYWTGEEHTLYMRDLVKRETIQIGGSELGGANQGRFQLASNDGLRVFYTELGSLYECEIVQEAGGLKCVASGKSTRLGEAPPEGKGGGQEAVIGASEDGSYVYWVSANHDLNVDRLVGGEWQLRQIATLSLEDAPDWEGTKGEDMSHLTARVSPDGRWLAFMSDRPLTGYDNRDANSGQPDEEAYVYDAETGRTSCASCNPTGARPVGVDSYGASLVDEDDYEDWNGNVGGGSSTWLSADLPGWVAFEKDAATTSRYQPRYLSNEGRLYFNSDDALVPKDINENWDVYEYEPENVPAGGEHACTSSSTSGSVVYKPARTFDTEGGQGEEGAGCVGLISSGESGQESDFLDASESGGDVFFMTTAKLAPQDFDDAYDVYDAHECTAESQCIAPPASPPPACTTADACRAAPTPQPGVYGAPSSATFNGKGNLAPPAVPKKTAAQVRAEKLTKALKVCKRDKKKAKRQTCEKVARKRYGPVKKAKAKRTKAKS